MSFDFPFSQMTELDDYDDNDDRDKFYEHTCFFDFEATTDTTPHQAYCVSFALDSNPIESFYGESCAIQFLESLPDKTLCLAHNISYDITFIIDNLAYIYLNPIIKDG